MSLSLIQICLLAKLKRHNLKYDDLSDREQNACDVLASHKFIEYEYSYEDVPGFAGMISNAEKVRITEEGHAAFDSFIIDRIAVWIGIIVDFALAIIGIILSM